MYAVLKEVRFVSYSTLATAFHTKYLAPASGKGKKRQVSMLMRSAEADRRHNKISIDSYNSTG